MMGKSETELFVWGFFFFLNCVLRVVMLMQETELKNGNWHGKLNFQNKVLLLFSIAVNDQFSA